MVSVLHILLGNHESGNSGSSKEQCELLLSLSRQRVDLEMEQKWTPIVGPLAQNIARFISKGLLEEASLQDKLDAKYRVADLKQMLEKKGVSCKGKKYEMIEAFVTFTPVDEAASLVADVRLYRATPAGQHRIDTHLAGKEKARLEMETEALQSLWRGDTRKAWARIAKYQADQILPDPKWSRPIPQPLQNEAGYLLSFAYNDLPLNEAQRKMVGAHLALSIMLGESFAESGRRLIKYTEGQFDWAQATAFHRPSPCGKDDACDAATLAEMYATTRIQEALASCELEGLMSDRLGKGIKILPVYGVDCSICHSGKYTYEWSEIDKLPKLPRQMGCQCTYAAWL